MSSRINSADQGLPGPGLPDRRSSGESPSPGQAKPCAVCGKPQAEAFRPFCSRRCADVDLHRWLSDGYALPAVEDDAGPADPGNHREGRPRDT
jgi:endogenous inhibitor of DNA gyrase (YacG/DUF329 family)